MKTKKQKMETLAILSIMILVLLAGCADSMSFEEASKAPQVGFLHGFWHGLIFPLAWVVSLFEESTAVYAIYNNGTAYDLGFFIGVGGFSATILSIDSDS